jgi:antitoxin MazE
MNARFSKWGNSIALRIPNSVAKELHVTDGHAAELRVKNGSLIVTPVSKRTYDRDEMIAAITPENLHEKIDSGEPVGNEAI